MSRISRICLIFSHFSHRRELYQRHEIGHLSVWFFQSSRSITLRPLIVKKGSLSLFSVKNKRLFVVWCQSKFTECLEFLAFLSFSRFSRIDEGCIRDTKLVINQSRSFRVLGAPLRGQSLSKKAVCHYSPLKIKGCL